MSSNPSIFGTDTFVDSEDLMSWLLLNPEMDFDLPHWTTSSNNPSEMLPPLPPLQPSSVFTNGYDDGGYSSVPSDNAVLPPHQSSSMNNTASIASSHATMPPVPPHPVIMTGTTTQPAQHDSIQSLPQVLSLKQEPQSSPPTQPLTVNTSHHHHHPHPPTLSSSASQSTLMSTKETTPRSSKKTVASKTATTVKKRPRESVEDLEARVNALKAENADLHAHLLNVTQRTTEVQKQRVAMEKLMAQKLAELGDRDDSDQSELANLVKQYTDIYADYGKCRQREVLHCLKMLLKELL